MESLTLEALERLVDLFTRIMRNITWIVTSAALFGAVFWLIPTILLIAERSWPQ